MSSTEANVQWTCYRIDIRNVHRTYAHMPIALYYIETNFQRNAYYNIGLMSIGSIYISMSVGRMDKSIVQ